MLPGGWDSAALAPFLTEGEFSSQWLQTISPAVLYQKDVEMGAPLPGGYDAIFTAISSNPDFAAKFYQQNSGQLNDYMTDPELYHILASGQGFGKFLEAATIPPQGDTSTKPFTDNAAQFVQLFGGGSQDTSSDVRQAMAAVAMNYFGDIQGTVTAAAPGAGSSMGLSASEWGSFVQNAMQDKTAAAFLMTSYASWRGQQTDDSLTSNGQGDGQDAADYAGYWNDQSIGVLDYFFASNYQAAGHQAGEGSNAVMETLTEAFNAGAATLLTSVAFGPEAGAVELLADAGKDAFSSAAESTLGKITGPLADSGGGAGNASDDADKVFSNLTTIQGKWSSDVTTAWNQSVQNAQHGHGLPAGLLQRRAVHRQPATVRAAVRRELPELGRDGDGHVPDERQAAGRVQRVAAGPGDLQRGGEEIRGGVPGVVQQLLQLAAERGGGG